MIYFLIIIQQKLDFIYFSQYLILTYNRKVFLKLLKRIETIFLMIKNFDYNFFKKILYKRKEKNI